MPLNQTKTDILLTLTELMYYCPLSFGTIGLIISKNPNITNKQALLQLKELLKYYKKYPSKKGQTR